MADSAVIPITELTFDNQFAQLSDCFYTKQSPTPLSNSHLVSFNKSVANSLGFELTTEKKDVDNLVSIASGQKLWPDAEPLAMVYSGHQFGVYNPQLGDGRGLLLGEVRTPSGDRWDLHLKGAGMTPYSRQGDGRAVLRSTIREYLCSEAMHHLGIPTTRALCIVGSDEPVYRETVETAATLIRVAKTHLRFGSFEYFYYTRQQKALKELVNFAIQQYYPELVGSNNQYEEFYRQTVVKTAQLIAYWQAFGFVHGVMNTDNMSLLGDTFDYGPFGFMDDYDQGFICNHSDHTGRYAFNQQPSIAYWNCACLGQVLVPFVKPDTIKQLLNEFEIAFVHKYADLMRQKLGLIELTESDQELVQQLFTLMQKNSVDYTLFFRHLCDFIPNEQNTFIRDLFIDRDGFDSWAKQYQQRLTQQTDNQVSRSQQMKSINPKYILRNYLAQQAIDKATKEQDFSEVNQLLQLLQRPFAEQSVMEHYAKLPPEWGKKLVISCSS
ncbi:protein adenylyltransferase SelO [Spartinivicinus ruber]|uniref:protein adenylyltransferase SelO n=1 Tax=Spartinivicinus ruber TaxID=2683272 RepID=UPI001CA4347C|nr:YdiU family protein [Spartinivicinus ruber]